MPSMAVAPPGTFEAFVDLPLGDGGVLMEIPLLKMGPRYP